jgi:hypothetical protein
MPNIYIPVRSPKDWRQILAEPGYSISGLQLHHQEFSELMDEAAPARTFIVALNGIQYPMLLMAFEVGIWTTASPKRAGRIIAALFGQLATVRTSLLSSTS